MIKIIILSIVLLLSRSHQVRSSYLDGYEWGLVNQGKLVVSSTEDLGGNFDISHASIVEIEPSVESRADPTAKYYLYYAEHRGMYIGMKWAADIEGPWNAYNAPVMDFLADSDRIGGKEDWSAGGHISNPDVTYDEENNIFVMLFHGKLDRDRVPDFELDEGGSTNFRHTGYVAFSKDGLNFNDPRTGGGQSGTWGAKQRPFGPLEVVGHVNGTRQDITVKVGSSYMQLVDMDGDLYGFSSSGVISRPLNPLDPWEFEDENQPSFSEWIWEDQSNDEESHISTWFASSEFANHPNNPFPGYAVYTYIKGGPKVNHIEPRYLGNRLVELYVNIRKDTDEFYPIDDPWSDLMRIVMDCTDPDWNNWSLLTHPDTGLAVFDVVVSSNDLNNAVKMANGANDVDGTVYADPVSMGVPGIIELSDGRLYLFPTFNSQDVNSDFQFSEGQITELQLFGDGVTPPPVSLPPSYATASMPSAEPTLPLQDYIVFIGINDGDTVAAGQLVTISAEVALVEGGKWVSLLVDGVREPKIYEEQDLYEFQISLSAGEHRLRIRARDGASVPHKSDSMEVVTE